MKIWTGRLSYIYKPIYASPPMESPRPGPAPGRSGPAGRCRNSAGGQRLEPGYGRSDASSPAESLDAPPPPNRQFRRPVRSDTRPGRGQLRILPKPNPPQVGQEI